MKYFLLFMLIGAGLNLQGVPAGDDMCKQRKTWQKEFSAAIADGEDAAAYELAIRLEEAREACGENPNEDLYYRAMLAHVRGDTTVPAWITKSLVRAEANRDSFAIVRALCKDGVIDFSRGKQVEGANKLHLGKDWFQRHNMPILAGRTHFNLAFLYEGISETGKAFGVCRDGLAYLEGREMDAEKRKRLRGKLFLMASHVMQGEAYFEESLALVDTSITLFQELKDTSSLVAAWIQMGGTQIEAGDADAAIITLNQANAMLDTTFAQNWYPSGQLQYVYANCLAAKGDMEGAIARIRISQSFYLRLGMVSDYYEARALQATLMAKMDDPKALSVLKEVFPVLWQEKKYEYLADISRDLAVQYTKLGQVDSSLVYWGHFMEVQDSMHSEEKRTSLELARTEYQTAEKERLIEVGQQELAQSAELARSQERFLWALGIGLGVVVLLGGLVVRAYLLAKRVSKKLGRQNEEKALLLREIHHRVRNNLQVVSNLLEMQSRGIEDPKMIELTREGQSRIRSISLIHQRLYQNESLTISVDDFVGSLVEETALLYKLGKINRSLEVDQVELDIDTAIPVGLILNELLTNVYKYAFRDKENKDLHVWLKRIGAHEFEMGVRDNGAGLPIGVDPQRTRSTGLRLVRRLAAQLHGKLTYQYRDGAEFVVEFKDTIARKNID